MKRKQKKCKEPSHWFWKKTKEGKDLKGPVGFNVAVLLGLLKVYHKKNKVPCALPRRVDRDS